MELINLFRKQDINQTATKANLSLEDKSKSKLVNRVEADRGFMIFDAKFVTRWE